MKLNDILIENFGSPLSREHKSILSGMGTDDIHKMDEIFDRNIDERGDFNIPVLIDMFSKNNIIVPKDNADVYLDALWDAIGYQMEMRDAQEEDDPYNDLRDYDEEDRQSAFNDKYQAYKNEY